MRVWTRKELEMDYQGLKCSHLEFENWDQDPRRTEKCPGWIQPGDTDLIGTDLQLIAVNKIALYYKLSQQNFVSTQVTTSRAKKLRQHGRAKNSLIMAGSF